MTWSPRFRPTAGTPTNTTTPSPGVPGRSVSKLGAFLVDVAGFDPEFFGISEREATRSTPSTDCCWKPPGRPWNMPVVGVFLVITGMGGV